MNLKSFLSCCSDFKEDTKNGKRDSREMKKLNLANNELRMENFYIKPVGLDLESKWW